MELNIVTIVAKNYLAQARVLIDSFKKNHPNARAFVLFIDSIDGYFDPEKENFISIHLSELRDQIYNFDGFCFQYSILELCTAVKPYILEHLFKKYNIAKLAYFDPDILITGSLQPIPDLLENYNIILTPHITQPYNDEKSPSEINIMQAGTYNLGFIALSNTEITMSMLNWWKERLYTKCIVDIANGFFVDQKWMDLVPGLFQKTYILREPGYNVAYWNLHERFITMKENEIICNNESLRFFHFSGYHPEHSDDISKHQNRHSLDSIGQAKKLFSLYSSLLFQNGFDVCTKWAYSYTTFDNNVLITDDIRKIYLNLPKTEKFANPFKTKIFNSFFQWLGKFHPTQIPLLESNQVELEANHAKGVNLVGYMNSEKGMGSAVKSNIKCLMQTDFPFVLNNIVDVDSLNQEQIKDAEFITENPYKINIIHINADQTPEFVKQKGAEYFKDRYSIGCWEWELSNFPEEWSKSFELLDEVWVASSFIHEAVARISPIPVLRMPHAIEVNDLTKPNHDKHFFGIPENCFVFLFIFDFDSYAARKNPQAAINAFKKAFLPKDNAVLVIKSSHSKKHLSELENILKLSENSNVIILDRVMTGEEVKSLMLHADCYVSLHRCEGFGLTIAEAMSLGKPVIATAYSGNTDFISPNNCYPVNYKLIEIDKDYGPYKKGWLWAEPDLNQAANLMRHVYEHKEEAAVVGLAAREYIIKNFSPEAIGKIYQMRLDQVTKKMLANSVMPPSAAIQNNDPLNVGQIAGMLSLQQKAIDIDVCKINVKSCKPIIGHFITFYKRFIRKSSFWLLNPLITQLREINTTLINAQNDLLTKINSLTTIQNDLLGHANSLTNTQNDLLIKVNSLTTNQNDLLGKVDSLIKTQDDLLIKINEKTNEIEILKNHINSNNSLMRPLIYVNKNVELPITETFDYCAFEQVFRGSEEILKGRLQQYIGLFKDKDMVLDVGCGRGEFLELLAEAGINAIGVDSNAEMINICQKKGLNAVQSDFMKYLSECPQGKFDGIFSSQFIEHITPEEIHSFFKNAYLKLRSNGIIVSETVNPYHLSQFRFFWVDPTHKTPIYPEVAIFLSQTAGFKDSKVDFLPCFGDTRTELLNPWDYGDYAIVGKKIANNEKILS